MICWRQYTLHQFDFDWLNDWLQLKRRSAVNCCDTCHDVNRAKSYSTASRVNIQCVYKEQYTRLLTITSANLDRFLKSFHCQIPQEILYTSIIQIIHLTLSMFLHYLVKLKNHNCYLFQGVVCYFASLIARAQSTSLKIINLLYIGAYTEHWTLKIRCRVLHSIFWPIN